MNSTLRKVFIGQKVAEELRRLAILLDFGMSPDAVREGLTTLVERRLASLMKMLAYFRVNKG